ncbi:MAG: NnrU family protein [Gammaproteobacteria bacterium]|nr:NnrU family protein [Gammaproteobacteria bacterium]
MWLLVLGWVLFLSAHLSPGVLGLREQLIAKLGEGRFRGIYIATSVTGMMCIIAGKIIAPVVTVWYPPAWGARAAGMLVLLGCVLFMGLFLPTNLRRLTRHPMLWGMSCWGIGHLLANGDLGSMLLFGGFTGYALISIWSLTRRGETGDADKYPLRQDLVVAIAGTAAYGVLLWLHPYFSGVALM